MKKIAKFYLVLCWAFFIVKLTSFPAQGEYAPAFSYLDKFVHVFLFFVLTSLLINILKDLFNKYWLIGIISFFISSSYSYLIEYCQLFIEGRFSSFFDLTAGIFGGLLAVFIAYELYYRQPKLLLHICCVGCGVYISQILKKRFKIIKQYNFKEKMCNVTLADCFKTYSVEDLETKGVLFICKKIN